MENLMWPLQIAILHFVEIKMKFHYHSVEFEDSKYHYGWKLKKVFSTYFFWTSIKFQRKISSKWQVRQNEVRFASIMQFCPRCEWFCILQLMSFMSIILKWSCEVSKNAAGAIHFCCCFLRQQNFRVPNVDEKWFT